MAGTAFAGSLKEKNKLRNNKSKKQYYGAQNDKNPVRH